MHGQRGMLARSLMAAALLTVIVGQSGYHVARAGSGARASQPITLTL